MKRGAANVELKCTAAADLACRHPTIYGSIGLSYNIIRRLAIFQVRVYLAGYRFKIDEYLRQQANHGPSEMHLLPQSAILDLAHRAGCRLLEIRQEDSAGMPWISQFFTFEKS